MVFVVVLVVGFVVYWLFSSPSKHTNAQINDCNGQFALDKTVKSCGLVSLSNNTTNYYVGILKSVRKSGTSYYLDLDVGRVIPLSFLIFDSIGVHTGSDVKSPTIIKADIIAQLKPYIGQKITLLSPNGKSFASVLNSLLPKIPLTQSIGVRNMIGYLNQCDGEMSEMKTGDVVYTYGFLKTGCNLLVNDIYVN